MLLWAQASSCYSTIQTLAPYGLNHALINIHIFKDLNVRMREIYAIYLLEKHKGKDLGKALFNQFHQWFNQEGFESFVVRALTDNIRAKRFYEMNGGKSIGEIMIIIGDKNYPEARYLFATQTS